jgi:hypothetical protein
MKTILFTLAFLLLFNHSEAQESKREKFLHVIEALFPNYELLMYQDYDIIITKVWDMHATIELDYCEIAELEKGIHAIAFEIYLSENPEDYEIMKLNEIYALDEVEEDSEFTGGDQRLIQVVFYDFINDTFIGKPTGFPLSGFPWLPYEITIPVEFTTIERFKTSADCENTCVLTIQEFSDMYPIKLYYVFKYHENEILNSGPIKGLLQGVYQEGNMIMGKFEEYNDVGEFEEYEEPIMSF